MCSPDVQFAGFVNQSGCHGVGSSVWRTGEETVGSLCDVIVGPDVTSMLS